MRARDPVTQGKDTPVQGHRSTKTSQSKLIAAQGHHRESVAQRMDIEEPGHRRPGQHILRVGQNPCTL